jgi:hypothetical protein
MNAKRLHTYLAICAAALALALSFGWSSIHPPAPSSIPEHHLVRASITPLSELRDERLVQQPSPAAGDVTIHGRYVTRPAS